MSADRERLLQHIDALQHRPADLRHIHAYSALVDAGEEAIPYLAEAAVGHASPAVRHMATELLCPRDESVVRPHRELIVRTLERIIQDSSQPDERRFDVAERLLEYSTGSAVAADALEKAATEGPDLIRPHAFVALASISPEVAQPGLRRIMQNVRPGTKAFDDLSERFWGRTETIESQMGMADSSSEALLLRPAEENLLDNLIFIEEEMERSASPLPVVSKFRPFNEHEFLEVKKLMDSEKKGER